MTPEELLTTTALDSWKLVTGRLSDGITALTDQQMEHTVAPGRNRISYLVGHLTAVNDRLFPMLSLGERLHPEFDDPYINNPDGKLSQPVSPAELKNAWHEVNTKLTAAIEAMKPEDWLKGHAAVSEEDFQKNPRRNRLAVLMSRTNHASFHAGQLILAK